MQCYVFIFVGFVVCVIKNEPKDHLIFNRSITQSNEAMCH